MKPSILLFGLSAFCQCALYAQEEVQLKDLKVPVAPAFSILDFAPKTIESPGTIRAFATNLVSNAAIAGGIPKNFAFEFAPYWFVKHPNMNIYKYYGLGVLQEGNDGGGTPNISFKARRNIFYGLRSTSISLGSVFKDSSKAMPVDVNYIGYALRSNIVNVRDARTGKELGTAIAAVNAALQQVQLDAITKCGHLEDTARLNCIGNFIAKSKDSVLKSARERFAKLLDVRPRFSVDVALASSTAFGNNTFSNRKSFRSGGWLTLAYHKPLVSRASVAKDIDNLINARNYLGAFFMLRRLHENKTADFKRFTEQNLLDIGGRLELEINRFSFSVESIRRINNSNQQMNSTRTVGIFQYKVSNSLYLLGTFGKDFDKINNIVSLFGLNWGFGENALNKSFQ